MLGFFLSLFIVFIFLGILIASIASFTKEEAVVVPKNTMLHLKLDKNIPDRTPKQPFEEWGISLGEEMMLGLNSIIENIKLAKSDNNIKGIYLDLSVIPASLATVDEIRDALLDFKSSGKFIISYSETYSQKAYYLATVSDKIFLNPEGYLEFKGLTAQLLFLKGTLEKLDIDMQIIRHGKFKSAVEPLILDKMSEANYEQTNIFITSMWNSILEKISSARNIPVQQLNQYADGLMTQFPEDALKYGFVDSLIYKDQLIAYLKEKLKVSENKKYSELSLGKYAKAVKQLPKERAKEKIAVIYAIGEIASGEGTDEVIGSERISESIRKAREDTTVKAIVIRVNSPGGSALASDVIWRETILSKQVKPVVVSMGEVAASGGYYISCAANKIFAHPTTITGSIGVFGVIPNLKDFMNKKLGVTFDKVNTNKYSDLGNIFRALSPYETQVISNEVEKIYSTFITHVGEGRKMDTAKVNEIGQGRVWSGVDAKRIGLIDEFGGLEQAIAAAAELAGLKKYKVVNLPEQKGPFELLLENMQGASSKTIKAEMGEFYKLYEYIKTISNLKGVQARLPFWIEIY